MSLGEEYSEAYNEYAEDIIADGDEPMTFTEWLNELDWESADDELESGMERTGYGK